MRTLSYGRTLTWALLAAIVAALTPASAPAQLFSGGRRACPCPPPVCTTPERPAAPSAEPIPPTTTPTPPAERPAPTEEAPSLPTLASGVQGGRGLAYGSANMWGEFFGSQPLSIVVQLTNPTVIIPPMTSLPPSTGNPPPTTNPIQRNVVIIVPSPAGGGVVGRSKISEDNNPLPRDRVFFDYDYFNRVPLSADDDTVHRYTLGFEKTFFDQMASIEFRVPFAATLDPDVVLGGTGNARDGEVGDVQLTLKGLLYAGDVLNVAAGLGISIPTGPDTRVSVAGGPELLRIKNESVILTPYLAYLVTPDDRLFFQNWFQIGFDANSNPVELNPTFAGIRNAGRLSDQTILQIDAQAGYWIYKSGDSSRWLTALAPFIELHYNTSLDDADSIQSSAFSLTSVNNRFDELNLTTGVVAQLGDNCTLALGAVFPLKPESDRSFDYQLGIRANIFFGPTARERSRTMAVPSF